MTNDKAPSATVDEIVKKYAYPIIRASIYVDDPTKEFTVNKYTALEWLTKMANELRSQQPTVDEPKHLSTEQRQAIFNFFHDKEVVLMDDDFNTIEGIVYPRTYPYTLKDSQQPTVEAEEISQRYAQNWFMRKKTGDFQEELANDFQEAIQEALQGRYTREDMFLAYMRRLPKHFLAEGLVKSFQDRDDFEKYITQYNTKRGKIQPSFRVEKLQTASSGVISADQIQQDKEKK